MPQGDVVIPQQTVMKFNRDTYFSKVRDSLFYGSLNQGQVDGQEAILSVFEKYRSDQDIRFLAYELATTIHETASTMLPIEEYGKGSGHDYGSPDPETGETYYGRGFVQLTWRDNYARADKEGQTLFGVNPGLEWNATRALEPKIAAAVMFLGMEQGWFRGDSEGRQTLERYFNENTDDPINARDIINGDISKNGKLIAGYHDKFFDALNDAWEEVLLPPEEIETDESDEPDEEEPDAVAIDITTTPGTRISLILNGNFIDLEA